METEQFLTAFPKGKAVVQAPLSDYSFTRTGGPAELLIFPKTQQEAMEMLHWLKEHQIPVTILGNASNVIIRDSGIDGAVLMLNEMIDIQVQDTLVIASGGAALIDTARVARDAHLTGLEFACGIPGSVGGAVFMNAGAYEGEVSDVIEYVDVVTPDGELKRYTNQELEFSYRHSLIQTTHDLVVEVGFRLQHGNVQEIQQKMDHLTELRTSKQPLEYPSCGSVFKRPPGHFTGKLIQDAGLQGYQIGGAQISMKHAGFIVNVDHATATDYLSLIEYIQAQIFERFQVQLEPEVRILGKEQASSYNDQIDIND